MNKAILEVCNENSNISASISFLSTEIGEISDRNEASALKRGEKHQTIIHIGYDLLGSVDEDGIPLLDDPWYAVGLTESIDWRDDHSVPIHLVEMREPLVTAALGYAARMGLSERLRPLKAQPSELAALLAEFPHARFWVPRSMIADRLGLVRAHLDPLAPELVSHIHARVSGPHTAGSKLLLDALQSCMNQPESNIAFDPELTARQISYFNLVQRCGGISPAARVANVTQPSISAQIQRLEATIGVQLLERRRNGVTTTAAGKNLLQQTMALEESLVQLVRSSRDVAAHGQSLVTLGMLPSSGHASSMTEKIAEALTHMHLDHPSCRVTVVEAPSSALFDMVRSGEVHLAIIPADHAKFARLPLGRSEPLSIVANPALHLAGRQSITLAEACALPMVLGPNHLSIHRTFIEIAEASRLRVVPVMEMESLPLIIALVRRANLCTVLPASGVRDDVRAGSLTATAIAGADIPDKLSVIFSNSRPLSEGERQLVRALMLAFKSPPGFDDDHKNL